MWDIFIGVLVPVVKWFFERKAQKKMNDKEFVAYILAHRQRQGKAAESAQEWEEVLEEAMNEVEEVDKEN